MVSKQEKLYSWPLPFIIVVAASLRLLAFTSWSLHNDELSTIFRAKYDSLSEVIEKGVMTDVHPWLSEVFIYFWMKLFGDSPFAVRLPYVIMGILAVLFFYKFLRSISGRTTAYLSTTVMASIQLFVLYSQIARPYAMGLFLMMLFAYCWKRLIDENNWKWSIIVGIIAALSAMTHYFLALSILLLYLVGVFWILGQRSKWMKYLGSGLISLIIFSPHLSMTIDQIAQKGLGWLSTPESDFFIDFIYFSLNESIWFILILLVSPLLAYQLGVFRIPSLKELSLSLVFIISFLIGYYYSVNVEAVIQQSTLIFSFPFLVFLPFSFFNDELPTRALNVLSMILLGLGILSLTISADFYGSKRFADFEKVAQHITDWKRNYADNISIITSSNSSNYLNYYYEQCGFQLNEDMNDFYGREKIEEAVHLIRENEKEFLVLAFANNAIPSEVYEYAKLYYPKIVDSYRYFNSEALLLSKEENIEQRTYSFMSLLSDRIHSDRWEVRESLYEDSLFHSAPSGFHIQENDLYALTYRAKVKHIFKNGSAWLTLKARMKSAYKNGMHLIVSTARGEERIDWRSVECDYFHLSDDWYQVVFVYQVPNEALADDDLSVYFWNPKSGSALIDDVELFNYEDSDFNYYQLP